MKHSITYDLNPLSEEYVFYTENDLIYIQDTTHIGTKLRNRLLKPSISLPFGIKAISLSHLKSLLQIAPKDLHGLVLSDISPDDRQNFRSLEKVMNNSVTDALRKYVIDSQATIVYINLCKNVTSSFLDRNLKPLERIYGIWNVIFLLRIWRKFICDSECYNLADNFISANSNDCIEINAYGLIQLVVRLRNAGKPAHNHVRELSGK